MDSPVWNQRYKDGKLVWSATPNVWVKQLTEDLPTGTGSLARREANVSGPRAPAQ